MRPNIFNNSQQTNVTGNLFNNNQNTSVNLLASNKTQAQNQTNPNPQNVTNVIQSVTNPIANSSIPTSPLISDSLQ